MKLERRLVENVPALTTIEQDYVPSDGEKLFFRKFFGASAEVPNTYVCIMWDADGPSPEILFATYREYTEELAGLLEKTGDGIKVLRLQMTNDATTAQLMSTGFIAESEGGS